MSSGLVDHHPSGPASSGHPLERFADALDALLTEAADANAWTMTPAELADVLPRLTRAKQRLTEVELRVLREADRQSVGDEAGATDTPAWWAHVTGQTVPAAKTAAALAEKLDTGHAPTRTALLAGRVTTGQVAIIVDAVEALPADDLGPALVADAEAHLVELADLDGATRLDPRALRIAGRKLLEAVAPDLAEDHERRLLEAAERQAAATAFLTMRPDGHGSMLGKFKIPVLHGEILAKHLNAVAAPRHQRATSGSATSPATSAGTDSLGEGGTRVARPLRWGRALMEYLETRDAARDGSPRAGGLAATVVVTMTLEQLLGGLQGSERGAVLDTGESISAGEARRLACEAGIIPAVLGSRSQPLDVGRKSRFHTEPQRTALMLRDGGCAAVGCDWPPGMCHAHHPKPWARGGGTSVTNGVLLCPRHHTRAHDTRYELRANPDGTVTLVRRT